MAARCVRDTTPALPEYAGTIYTVDNNVRINDGNFACIAYCIILSNLNDKINVIVSCVTFTNVMIRITRKIEPILDFEFLYLTHQIIGRGVDLR